MITLPKQNALKIYVPEEFREDIIWAKEEFPNKPFNKILLELLHEARVKTEAGKTAALEKMTECDTEQAKTIYTKKFGFLATDYKNDQDVMETLGTNKIYNLLEKAFQEINLQHPKSYNYCVELFRQEHAKLYEIWK